jgi:hypothetical protein
VFYDIIGRVVPGMFLLILAFLLFRREDWRVEASQICFADLCIPHVWLFLGGLLASYMVGIILSAIGYTVAGREWTYMVAIIAGAIGYIVHWRNRKKSEPAKTPCPKTVDSPECESYVYDVIQIREPAAGARLVKLNAERNMCRVLIAGFLLLLVGSHFNGTGSRLVVDSLSFGIASALLFHLHLSIRSRNLMRNLWDLLVAEGRVQPRSTVRTLRSATSDHEPRSEPKGADGQAAPAGT